MGCGVGVFVGDVVAVGVDVAVGDATTGGATVGAGVGGGAVQAAAVIASERTIAVKVKRLRMMIDCLPPRLARL